MIVLYLGLSISKTQFRPMGWGDGLDVYPQLECEASEQTENLK